MCAVEWKKLGDVCKVHTGEQLNRNDMVNDGQFPVINGGKEPSGYTNSFNELANSITISQGGESAGYVNWIDNDFWAGAHCYVVENNDSTVKKFLYYSLKNIEIILQSTKQGAGIPGLNRKKLYEQVVPIPSLAKQQEIVSHLDTFTTLISNLESELDMRRKQYEHYRNQLLDFEGVEGVEWKKTKDICTNICSGGTPLTSNQEYYNGTIPWLRTQEVDWGYVYDTKIKITQEAINNSSAKMIPADCVIIAMYGATAAKCCINKIPLSTNQACCNLEINNNVALYKYVYYWYCKEYANLKAMGEGSQNNISGNKIKSYLIPIPSLDNQTEIVSKLDSFENLIQSLEQEIKLRKRQYEYYREKLLTFE